MSSFHITEPSLGLIAPEKAKGSHLRGKQLGNLVEIKKTGSVLHSSTNPRQKSDHHDLMVQGFETPKLA